MLFNFLLLAFAISQCCSVNFSKFTLERIKSAIDNYERNCCQVLFVCEQSSFLTKETDCLAYISPPILIWDAYKWKTDVTAICCHICSSNGVSSTLRRSSLWTDGVKGNLPPRVIYDTSSFVILVSAIYKCSLNHLVPSHHVSVLSSLSSGTYVPFYLTNRAGFTANLLVYICSLVDHGVSFLGIEGIIRDQYIYTYNSLKERYIHSTSSDGKFPDFNQDVFPYPHEKILRNAFLGYSSIFEKYYAIDMAKRTSTWLTCDHTFKSAANIGYHRQSDNLWINMFKCVFCVLGKEGNILHWKFTRGESFDEVRHIFQELKSRMDAKNVHLEGIVIDNCCKWKGMLAGILPDVPIKLDLFHATQRLTKTLSATVRRSCGVAKEYGLIFRQPDDLGEQRKKETAELECILRNICNFEDKWKRCQVKGQDVLNEQSLKAITNLKVHVRRGCLSNIPVHCSTSRNERLHRNMNTIIQTNKIGVDLAYQRISRLFFKMNNNNHDVYDKFRTLSAPMQSGNSVLPDMLRQNFGMIQNVIPLKERSSPMEFDLSPEKHFSFRSIKELTTDNLSLIKAIIIDSSARAQGDHDYVNYKELEKLANLEVSLDAISFFEMYCELVNKGCSKFVTKSSLPFSIGLGIVSAKKMETLATQGIDHTADVHEVNLRKHLEGFGLSIVPIEGDGNCFFSAVSFQILNLMTSTSTDEDVIAHLNYLGITSNMNNNQLARLLRKLLVEEWKSDRSNQYIQFLPSALDFNLEVENFEQENYFSGPLGDLMPLGMANILNIPMAIISSQSHTPIISVCPERIIPNSRPIFMAYTSFGPGHYDAAVVTEEPNSEDTESSIQENTEKEIPFKGKTAKLPAYGCRCSFKKSTQKYKSRKRCKCILRKGECCYMCRCDGFCCGTKCKTKVLKGNNKRRHSRVREKHILQAKRPAQGSAACEASDKSINFLEVCFLCAVLQFLKKKNTQYEAKEVHKLYEDVLEHLASLGIILPLQQLSLQEIMKEINKIERNFKM